jgi:diguanylate cyclase (GGDEF)-like protein
MDYRTLFLTFLASLSVYTACACLLAWRNRSVVGLSWIAAGLVASLGAVILQGLEGKIPTFFSSFISNELYFPSFVMQMFGLRWFVDRSPLDLRWLLRTGALLAALYAVLYFFHIGYVANVINIPTILILATTAWLLLRHGHGIFAQASRWASVFLFGEMVVYTYRAALTNMIYTDPWLVSGDQHDPRWLYSMMVLMFFSTCVIMCDFWFFVLELQRELMDQARTDPLTGALNRRALYEEADREISRSLRSNSTLCLLLLDIDDFKLMNDTFGHAAGDYVLCRLVEQIKATLRTQDILARTGGEEFAILLPETTRGPAGLVAERIRLSLQNMTLIFGTAQMKVSVSIGLAEMTAPFASFDTFLHRADEAMYAAKRSGKNRTVSFEPRNGPPDFGAALSSQP